VTTHLEEYELDKAVQALYDFTWRNHCDWYLEMVKPRIQGADAASRAAAQVTLLTVTEHICRLLHPFTPFATEEIWQILRARTTALEPGQPGPAATRADGFADGFAAPSLCVASWPAVPASAIDEEADAAVALFQETVGAIRNIRGEMRVPADLKLEVLVEHGDGAARASLEAQASAIRSLAGVQSLRVAESVERPRFVSTYVSGAMTLLVVLPEDLLASERDRLAKEIAFSEKGMAASHAKLANEKFAAKAPEAVVQAERDRCAKLEADVAALRARLAEIGG
jgi:valyl-tRNA synthetase